jgi:hypothetical protein
MNRIKQFTVIFGSIALLTVATNLFGQVVESSDKINIDHEPNNNEKIVGFEDLNQDGINDHFYDRNGDGINDLNNKKYGHRFDFIDNNNDNINDIWMDRDGDGVNDLYSEIDHEMHENIHNNILDYDEDGFNDITGDKYDKSNHNWMGDRWGFWDEMHGRIQGVFLDDNGDGIDDRTLNSWHHMERENYDNRMMDQFIDEDGDGICDWRTDFLNRMGNHGNRNKQNNKSHNH